MLSRLIERSLPTVMEISRHKFNQELQLGILDQNIFFKFLALDRKIYLPGYVKAYEILVQRFKEHGLNTYAVQFDELVQANRNYIDFLYSAYPASLDRYAETKTTTQSHGFFKPNAQNMFEEYISRIIHKVQTAPLPEAIASVTACVWLYMKLGENIDYTHIQIDNPYKDWLITYNDPDFVSSTVKLMQTLQEISEREEFNHTHESIITAFHDSMLFEYKILESMYDYSPESNAYNQDLAHTY
jgi:thiaminase